MSLGNPAPLGLFCFAFTTLTLMYVDMGWVEHDGETLVYGMALWFGGVMQALVGVFELIKGSTFSFAVFGAYGAFWLAWSSIYLAKHDNTSEISEHTYRDAKVAFYIQWGILTCGFFIITLRKNICLIIVFALLATTFFLLAIATALESTEVKKLGGYFGFVTALGAFYVGMAELINEEWGRNVLPGLAPLVKPERLEVTKESIMKLIQYDRSSNTLWLYFAGLQIHRLDAVEAIREGVEEAITESKAPDNKVHVVADYRDVVISGELEHEYWAMAGELERKYYLSVRRFAVSAFGTKSGAAPMARYSFHGMPTESASVGPTGSAVGPAL